MGVVLIDLDVASAIDRKLCMTAVCKQTVTVYLSIDITIDGDFRSHLHCVVAAAVDQRATVVAKCTLTCTQSPFMCCITHSCHVAI